MTQTERHHALEDYAAWLIGALKQQGVSLAVVSADALHVKGKLTAEQKENIRLWKRQLINALSPKCSRCTLPMRIIENGSLWLCPFGCQSLEVERMEQTDVGEYNLFVDCYNAALDKVQSDDAAREVFEVVLDEQKAVAIVDGSLSEAEAEALVRDTDNIRRAVLIAAQTVKQT